VANIHYNKLHMIVADDFSSFRATVSAMLNKLGVARVESVSSGREVLQLCSKKRYDVVLCDYDLGPGKNGQQVLEELRHRDLLPPSSLFILITADTSRSVVMSAYDCEPDDYMTKPITAQALEQRLTRLLRQRQDMMTIYQAIEDKNYDLATTLLASKASGRSRSSTLSQKLLGELLLEVGEFKRAENLYANALRERELDWARLGLARAKRAQGETEEALNCLNKLIDDSPLYLRAYDEMAEVWRERGDKQALQGVIQDAVDISPMSILRQQRLGRVAEENQDLACAVKAFRRSIKLGQNSCHAKPEDNFGFARTVAAAKEKGLEEGAQSTEALLAINAAKERFALSKGQEFQASVLQGRVHASQGREEEARKALPELDEAIFDMPDLELAIDYIATLKNLGDKAQSDALLNKLLAKHKHNQQALERLDILLDEPASDSNRKFVARINQEGIQLYEQRLFDDAIDRFKQASKLFPNNTGIQLNIAQTLLGKLRASPDDEGAKLGFQQIMERVGGQVGEKHPQYERFSRLRALAKSSKKNSDA
jgi:CheY-like chemotaxis protein